MRRLQSLDQGQAAAKKEEEKTKANAEKQANEARAKARAKQLEDCLGSVPYQLQKCAWEIEQGEQMIKNGEAKLQHDDEVKAASGVTDLALRRAAGEELLAGKALVERAFGEYRKIGGTAKTPEDVHAGVDPCNDYL